MKIFAYLRTTMYIYIHKGSKLEIYHLKDVHAQCSNGSVRESMKRFVSQASTTPLDVRDLSCLVKKARHSMPNITDRFL